MMCLITFRPETYKRIITLFVPFDLIGKPSLASGLNTGNLSVETGNRTLNLAYLILDNVLLEAGIKNENSLIITHPAPPSLAELDQHYISIAD
jgi:hypothetical protein